MSQFKSRTSSKSRLKLKVIRFFVALLCMSTLSIGCDDDSADGTTGGEAGGTLAGQSGGDSGAAQGGELGGEMGGELGGEMGGELGGEMGGELGGEMMGGEEPQEKEYVEISSDQPHDEMPMITEDEQAQFVAKNQELTFRFHLSQPQLRQKNQMLSLWSIRQAFSLLYPGTSGETKELLSTYFGFDSDLDIALNQVNAVTDQLEALNLEADEENELDPVQISVANSIWIQDGIEILTPYLDLLSQYLNSSIYALDFVNQPDQSREIINGWVEDKTADRIVDLIPVGGVTNLTRTVLVNAVYLKAPWKTPFNSEFTHPAPFTLLSGEEVEVDTMVENVTVRSAQVDGNTIIALPLRGDRLEMVFILPETTDDLGALEDSLTTELWNEWNEALSFQGVNLFLPKFTFKTGTLSLTPFLNLDGLSPLFGPAAQIDQILNQESLSVSDVVHQTFFAVDEGGVEAAAATAIILGIESEPDPVPTVQLNRPFLFAIHDAQTGMILFFGRLMNPLQ